MTQRTISISLTPSHPDFPQAKQEALWAKAYKNTCTAITRNRYFYKRDGENADLSISNNIGIDVKSEEFSYNKNFLGKNTYYSPIRATTTPLLHSKICQAIARNHADDWTSYWKLKANGRTPSLPGYSRSKIGAPVPYTKGMLAKRSLAMGVIRPTTWGSGLGLPAWLDPEWVQSARLVPIHAHRLKLVILYNDPRPVGQVEGVSGLSAAIDYGKNNFVTLVYSDYREGQLYSGKPMLEVLNHYNVLCRVLQSKHDVERGCIAKKDKKDVRFVPRIHSERLEQARWKCRVRLANYFTLVNNLIVESLVDAGVELLVIGWNSGFKSGLRLGRRNNRQFMGIPHALARDDLVRKCGLAGIRVVVQEESFTSKGSFVDGDFLPVWREGEVWLGKFSGTRVKRGLYKAAGGSCVNADVNGAYNILRKGLPSFMFSVSDCLKGCGSVVPRARNAVLPRV